MDFTSLLNEAGDVAGTTAIPSSTNAIAATSSIFGALAGFFAAIAITLLVLYVLSVIANWRIFTKAGEEGWKSLIPIYNIYIKYNLFWDAKFFWILLICSLCSSIPQIKVISVVISIIFSVVISNKISKSFGHGVGFTLGLIFLPTIFYLILGFDSSEYNKIEE